MEWKQEEIRSLFEKISEAYFHKNFGSMSKSDFETLLFSEYIEHCIRNGIPYDDYSLSKELGITQTRIRSLKERKELKYPYEEFRWQDAFAREVVHAKYDENEHYVKMIIEDINVMNEVRHHIESKGWYDECSLNKKLLKIPLDCFVEICSPEESLADAFTDETKEKIKSLEKREPQVAEFIKDFSKEGLKALLMSASKDVILTILPMLPFGGTAKVAFGFLEKAVKGA